MTKEPKKIIDALSMAQVCDDKANDLRESLPTIAQAFTDAGAMIRMQHQALIEGQCPHVLTFNVTKEMIAAGRESREPGKYCMTCGASIPKPAKKKSEETSGDTSSGPTETEETEDEDD